MRNQRFTLLVAVLLLSVLSPAGAQSRTNLIDAQLGRLARALVRSYRQLDPRLRGNAVVVADFTNDSEVARRHNLGFVFAGLLSDYLVQNVPELRVVERNQVARILEQQELAVSDLAAGEAIIRVGQLTQADLLVLGSVFELGENVRVNGRVVDAQSGEVLASEEIPIPTKTFVQASQALLALSNSLSLEYSLFMGSDHGAHLVSATYTYSFSRGLSLGLTLFYHRGIGTIDETIVAPGPDYRYFETRPQMFGTELLLGYHLLQSRPVSFLVQAGPLLAWYWDETILASYTASGTPYDGGQKVSTDALMFGVAAHLCVCIRLSSRVDLLAGGQMRLCPDNNEMKEFLMVPVIGGVNFLDGLELMGGAATLGVRFSF